MKLTTMQLQETAVSCYISAQPANLKAFAIAIEDALYHDVVRRAERIARANGQVQVVHSDDVLLTLLYEFRKQCTAAVEPHHARSRHNVEAVNIRDFMKAHQQ